MEQDEAVWDLETLNGIRLEQVGHGIGNEAELGPGLRN